VSASEVTVVRVYLTEGEHQFQRLMRLLHDEEKVRGVTAFRGIAGFGQSGRMHSASLVDVSLDLPLVLEFFDEPGKVARVLEHLRMLVPPGRILSWSASVDMGE
jgi:PII-like signaling protein